MKNSVTYNETISELDAFLSSDDVFLHDFKQNRAKLTTFLYDAVCYHIKNNQYYADYCKKLGYSPSHKKNNPGLIPILPSAIFKRDIKYVQSNCDDSVLVTTSSGTQGSISKVPRDNNTLMRFFASVAAGVQDIFEIKQTDFDLYCLSPSFEEVEHLWISYVITGVSVYFPSQFYVSKDLFNMPKLINDLRNLQKNNLQKKIAIIGPPALILDTTKELERTTPLKLGSACRIITMGGWKSRQGEMVERKNFDKRITQAFGLDNDEYVRDVYNMVELNTVIFECARHQKHCPPWLFVRARNAKTLKIKSSGEMGILSFADATPTSYPGFILSDDFGRVHEKVTCPCGITSDIIEIERRISKIESRGCALKI